MYILDLPHIQDALCNASLINYRCELTLCINQLYVNLNKLAETIHAWFKPHSIGLSHKCIDNKIVLTIAINPVKPRDGLILNKGVIIQWAQNVTFNDARDVIMTFWTDVLGVDDDADDNVKW